MFPPSSHVTLRLTPAIVDHLDRLAGVAGTSRSWVARRIFTLVQDADVLRFPTVIPAATTAEGVVEVKDQAA